MRDSTIIYRSFYEAIKDLPAVNQAEVWNAVFEYSLNLESVELTGISKTIFTLIRPQLDANIQRFKNGKRKKSKRDLSESEAEDEQTVSEQKAKPKQNRSKTEANNNNNVNNNKNEKENNNLPFSSQEFLTAWNDFITHRKQIKKPATQKARELLLEKCRNWGEAKAIAAIEKTIENRWTGLFEPDEKDMAKVKVSTSNEYSHLLGYNAAKHNNTDEYTFRISPGGKAIDYFRK